MAGTYPDVPGNRFAYDLDGTALYRDYVNNSLIDVTASAPSINDEDGDTLSIPDDRSHRLFFIFPELRNIDGYYFYASPGIYNTNSLEYSSDTTDGVNGTWTDTGPFTRRTSLLPTYRSSIESLNLSNVKGLRFRFYCNYGNIVAIHLYGSTVSGENTDRLRFWHPTTDAPTSGSHFDWGDVAQGTVHTRDFRVKNNSSSLTATGVTLTLGSPSGNQAAYLEYSSDGGATWNTTLNIGDLAPGTLSGVITVRRTVPADSTLNLSVARLRAVASGWS